MESNIGVVYELTISQRHRKTWNFRKAGAESKNAYDLEFCSCKRLQTSSNESAVHRPLVSLRLLARHDTRMPVSFRTKKSTADSGKG